MKGRPNGRLELTWMGKNSALIPSQDGKYDYAWVDPDDPRVREIRTLETVTTYGDTAASPENLVIIGDSGDALRSLGTIPEYKDLYSGQVNLVYIDPPFNTEQMFENYADQLEHSVWLTMMRDRLHNLRPLLARDASVWVHLDDSEDHRMRVLMDEEFGAENFVANISWQRVDNPSSRSADKIIPSTDSILVYSANGTFRPNKRLAEELPAHYDKVDEAGRRYCSRSLRKAGKAARRQDRPTMWFPIQAPDGSQVWPIRGDGSEGRWQWGQDKVYKDYDNLDWLHSDRGGLEPFIRIYPPEDYSVPFHTWWPYEEVGSNRVSKLEIKALFPDLEPFDTPKPEKLLARVLEIATNPGDLVLDFFAGSGTTAAVAHKMGRRWITVELVGATAKTFTIPRLRKVVDGTDKGGVTSKEDRLAVDGLPAKMTTKDAEDFNRFLGRALNALEMEELDLRLPKSLVKEIDEDKLAKIKSATVKATVKALKDVTKTRKVKTTAWEGGGGFTVAKVGPSMYDVDDELGAVFLSEAATNGAWSKALAGQLGYKRTPNDPVFAGVKGRTHLAVIDGVVDEDVIRTVVEHLIDGERALVVGKSILDGADRLLTELAKGSRVKRAPEDLFRKDTVK